MHDIIVVRGEHNTGKVWLDGKPLDLNKSLRVRDHSPTGFAWGYNGSGPVQLALAILLEVTDKETALKHYQQFKFHYISALPQQKDFNQQFNIREWLEKEGTHG